ncbi:hypothetical protein FA13DRAFT_1718671 [Coprinellus micaceus]|uniref:Uncharacterized protein n=1 Tax=Coprinellus micaceus TaxID=71717 RepID=A0A4Y7SDN1_COPMI|nr:hypothetical protein FA13DRAFT_1718671 [Coprinellus micaceus]
MPPTEDPPAALPIEGHSIGSFLDLLSQLLADERAAEFVILVLTGRYLGRQVSLEALRNRIYNEEDDNVHDALLYQYKVSRDIDSALGIADDICVKNHPISFYVIPKYSGSLKSSVGISHKISVDGVKLHKIPNSLFAKWGVRNEILIFFPNLYKKGERQSYKVHNDDVALFFENVTRPSLVALMPDMRGANFAPTFAAEMWRSRSETGHLVHSGRILSGEVVSELSGQLRDELAAAIGRGIRGVKDANAHHPVDAEDAIDRFIEANHLDPGAINDYPDDCHTAILRDILQIPEVHAVRMTKIGSSSYAKDPVSHMSEVAGCRITPGIVKIQAYHTDKAVTAALGGGHYAKHISLEQLISDKDGGFLDKLFNVYEDSMAAEVVANARLEVRVPFRMHSRVYDGLEGFNWRRYLVAVPCDDWWTLRLYSLIAYKAVAGSQLSSIPADRTNFSAVTLLMAIVWLTNSLHATPDTGPSSRQLLGAVLPPRPLVGMPEGRQGGEDEGDDDEDREAANDIVRQPTTRRFPTLYEEEESDDDDEDEGAVALRAILHAERVRLRILSGMAWGDFVDKIYTGILFQQRSITRTRTNTKQRPVVPEEGEKIPIVFALKNGHKKIPKPEWKGGEIAHGEPEEVEQVSRNEYLSLIYHQLFVDASPSHLLLEGGVAPTRRSPSLTD